MARSEEVPESYVLCHHEQNASIIMVEEWRNNHGREEWALMDKMFISTLDTFSLMNGTIWKTRGADHFTGKMHPVVSSSAIPVTVGIYTMITQSPFQSFTP